MLQLLVYDCAAPAIFIVVLAGFVYRNKKPRTLPGAKERWTVFNSFCTPLRVAARQVEVK